MKPVTVNIGRAGAANLDVIQEVEFVKQEAKVVYLLECLQVSALLNVAMLSRLPQTPPTSLRLPPRL